VIESTGRVLRVVCLNLTNSSANLFYSHLSSASRSTWVLRDVTSLIPLWISWLTDKKVSALIFWFNGSRRRRKQCSSSVDLRLVRRRQFRRRVETTRTWCTFSIVTVYVFSTKNGIGLFIHLILSKITSSCLVFSSLSNLSPLRWIQSMRIKEILGFHSCQDKVALSIVSVRILTS